MAGDGRALVIAIQCGSLELSIFLFKLVNLLILCAQLLLRLELLSF